MGMGASSSNKTEEEIARSEKGHQMTEMPDGTLKDTTDMTPEEVKDEFEGYRNN